MNWRVNLHIYILNFNFTYSISGFPGGSKVKDLPAKAGYTGLIPGSGRFPGEGSGNPLQYSCLVNPMDRERSLTGYSPYSHKELNMTEWLSMHSVQSAQARFRIVFSIPSSHSYWAHKMSLFRLGSGNQGDWWNSHFCLIFEEEIFCLFLMMFPFIWRKLHLHFANGFSFLVYWVLLSWIHVNINWKECCWSWSFNTLATLCKEPKANSFIWCWERLKAKGEGGSRGWDD